VITESIFIQQDISTVFNAFADLSNWQRVLSDVLNVETLYDDAYHQEFLMTVERPKGAETIRGIRFCCPNSRIELFQPEPPPGYKRMTGVWTFDRSEGGTQVTAERWFQLATLASTTEPSSAIASHEEAGGKLRGYLRKNLGLFKANLEG